MAHFIVPSKASTPQDPIPSVCCGFGEPQGLCCERASMFVLSLACPQHPEAAPVCSSAWRCCLFPSCSRVVEERYHHSALFPLRLSMVSTKALNSPFSHSVPELILCPPGNSRGIGTGKQAQMLGSWLPCAPSFWSSSVPVLQNQVQDWSVLSPKDNRNLPLIKVDMLSSSLPCGTGGHYCVAALSTGHSPQSITLTLCSRALRGTVNSVQDKYLVLECSGLPQGLPTPYIREIRGRDVGMARVSWEGHLWGASLMGKL